jgi:hypothetical protein
VQGKPAGSQSCHRTAGRVYGQGDLADRAAYATLKKEFEKCGDQWVAKGQTVA